MYRPGIGDLVVFLLVVSLSMAPAAGAAVTPAGHVDGDAPEFDRSVFEIDVHDDGSATWTFAHERVLENQSEVEDFEAFAETFETEETDLYERFQMQAGSLVATGENQTDREMAATDFERSAEVREGINRQGVVEMSFTWHGFAAVDEDGTVTVSDVFDGRLPLLADQTLTIEAGDGLRFASVSPDEPEAEYSGSLESASSVSWQGEMEFSPNQPSVVLEPEDGATASAGGDGDGLLSTLTDGWTPVVLLVVVIALVAALAWVGRRPDGGPIVARLRSIIGDADAGPTSDAEPPAGADGGSEAVEATDEDDPFADPEFMTDEDRVVALVRENGGRMKQVNIVDETGWSKSKVSMLLSEMEEEGTISKLRVGRENIISLDGFEPEATKSPFEES